MLFYVVEAAMIVVLALVVGGARMPAACRRTRRGPADGWTGRRRVARICCGTGRDASTVRGERR
ncbi:hypothetical protein ACU686_21350 [Yinghuangia aomiensis]